MENSIVVEEGERACVNYLLRAAHSSSPSLFALLLLLLRAQKMGYLYLERLGNNFNLEEDKELTKLALQGWKEITPLIERKIEPSRASSPLVMVDDRLYFARSYSYELLFKEALSQRREPPSSPFSGELSPRLSSQQKDAIHFAFQNPICAITGGPGSGKTFVASHLIEALSRGKEPIRIVLTAPTAKAASNLASALKVNIGISDGSICVKTLHALLEAHKERSLFERNLLLPYDCILLDEASMAEASLLAKLLHSLTPAMRLIMLGDSDQLPPVEGASLFQGAINSSFLPTIRLTTPFRTKNSDLLSLAEAVREGEGEMVAKLLQNSDGAAIEWLELPEEGADRMIEQLLARKALPYFDYLQTKCKELPFCLLTPLREGPLGSQSLNDLFLRNLSDHPYRPILITENSDHLGLSNGDQAILSPQEAKVYLFKDGEENFLEEKRIPRYSYGYALSVHKSQGCEFATVFLLLPPSTRFFGRELIYTAVTRAKKKLIIACHLPSMISLLNRRQTQTISL